MSAGIAESLQNGLTGRLAGRLAGRVQAPGPLGAAQVVSWLDLVDLCRELDDSLVTAETPAAEVLALHEAVLNLAIGCGGWLLHQIRARGIDLSASGQTLETLGGLARTAAHPVPQPPHPLFPPWSSRPRGSASLMPRPEYIARLHGASYDLRTCERLPRIDRGRK
jgi:hypothetical protein